MTFTGYRKKDGYSSNQIYTEAQSDNTNFYTIKEWGSPPIGMNTYNVDFVWTGSWNTSYWRFLLNGSSKWSIGYSELGWSPSSIQVFNELHDSGDQVAGTTSNYATWNGMYYKSSTTGLYGSLGLTRNISSSISDKVGTNMYSTDTAWETWDKEY